MIDLPERDGAISVATEGLCGCDARHNFRLTLKLTRPAARA
jgi:hypothetical protein